MKRITAVLLAMLLLVTACISSASPGPQKGEKIEWKFAHISDQNHIWHKTAVKFAELVEKKSDGQIEVSIYPNSQLGGEVDTINSIKTGAVDLTISGETMQNWAPKAALLAVPYAFRNQEHMRQVIEGEIGKEIEREIENKVGVTPLFYMERAPRNLTSNRPIHRPKDLHGFKMRVPNVPLFMETWEAAGAKPSVMDLSEVFTGLQQGVIHGQENPSDLIYSNGFYEVQKYVNETEHVFSWIYVVIGNEQLAVLSDEQRTAVMEAAQEAQQYSNQLLETETKQVIAQLKAEGMIINDDVDQKAFQKAMIPAIKNSLTPEQYELYQRILQVR